jgi:aldehyde:ferredoxin oxidoreductase
MGAVMGSKNLKAIVFQGSKEVPVAYTDELKELSADGYREILTKPNYAFWKQQGTMSTIEWSQENSTLPTRNFSEGVFDEADKIGGFAMEKIKISNRGCPACNMTCGNIVTDSDKKDSELDYESVAMLGSNIGLGNLAQVATLNRLADEFGLDTISLGNVLGFAIETSQKNLTPEKLHWGKFHELRTMVRDIAERKGLGDLLADGVQAAAAKIGQGSENWAMHVKGLEISAYDCHAAPGMALSYATNSIGAHHKDAFVIGWEIKSGRETYGDEKVDKVIEMQLIRGGILEYLTLCRLPFASLGFETEWYPRFLHAATGTDLTWTALTYIADRILTLIRAFWIREYGKKWTNGLDIPPVRWFDEPLTKGPLRGSVLDEANFASMLLNYYKKRGWDERGVPKRSTLNQLGISNVAKELNKYIELA